MHDRIGCDSVRMATHVTHIPTETLSISSEDHELLAGALKDWYDKVAFPDDHVAQVVFLETTLAAISLTAIFPRSKPSSARYSSSLPTRSSSAACSRTPLSCSLKKTATCSTL